jgi:uncharacterized protein
MDKLYPLTSLDIEITTHCNLHCSYCYLCNQTIKGREERQDMTDETLDKILEFCRQNHRKDKNTMVHFYGGEPMLRFEKVRYFIEGAKKLNIPLNYTVFTNGVVGTPEIAQYCKDNKVHLIRGLSGCKAAQDTLRPNTYEKFQEMTKLFSDERGHRRMTVTPETIKWAAQGVRECVEAGSIGATPMLDYYANWTEEDMKELDRQMYLIGEFFVERVKMGKPFYTYYHSRDMACRYTNKSAQFYCSAGKTLICFSVTGYMYPCHRFVTEPIDGDCCFGHIDEILNATAKGFGNLIKNRHIECQKRIQSEKCLTCEGRYGCEQGCHHSNWKTTGDMSKPPEVQCRVHITTAKVITDLIAPALKDYPDWWAKGNIRPEAKAYLKRRSNGSTGFRFR